MKQTLEEAFLVFSLVSERLGKSRYHKDYPVFAYESDEDDYGYYYPEDNEIIISDKALTSRENLLRTVLHEYTHYLQDPKELQNLTSEDEAYAAEEQWTEL